MRIQCFGSVISKNKFNLYCVHFQSLGKFITQADLPLLNSKTHQTLKLQETFCLLKIITFFFVFFERIVRIFGEFYLKKYSCLDVRFEANSNKRIRWSLLVYQKDDGIWCCQISSFAKCKHLGRYLKNNTFIS